TEPVFTFDVKNVRHPDAAAAFDLMIEIEKLAIQLACQAAPNRRLAGAHHPDQENGRVVWQRHGLWPVFRFCMHVGAHRSARCSGNRLLNREVGQSIVYYHLLSPFFTALSGYIKPSPLSRTGRRTT